MDERAAPQEAKAREAVSDEAASDEASAAQAAEAVDRDLDELGATKRERDEYLELAQRTRADFENYRKRVAGDITAATARGKAELAKELIPAIDNLERALGSAGADPESDSLAQGVELVYRELRAALERAGVESYDPTGEEFDPELHEALTTRPDEAAGSGRVLETADRGYRLDGQVLRPARVVVSE